MSKISSNFEKKTVPNLKTKTAQKFAKFPQQKSEKLIKPNISVIYTFEYYMMENIVVVVSSFLYDSIDLITPLFIIIWYIEQAGNVKMNLTKSQRLSPVKRNKKSFPHTMGVTIHRSQENVIHRYAQI